MTIKQNDIPITTWSAYNAFARALHTAFNEAHPGLHFPAFCDTESGVRMEELVQELWDEGFEIAMSEYEDEEYDDEEDDE